MHNPAIEMVCSKAGMDTESVTDMFDEVFLCDEFYSIGIVRTQDRFLALREMWDSLVEQHGSHQPFLCHAWFRIWLKHFQGSAELFIAIITRRETPVLIAPLLITNQKYKKVASVRKIEFVGNHHSPIRYFIYGEQETSIIIDSLKCLFRYLKEEQKNWDILELDAMPVEKQPCIDLKNLARAYGLSSRQYVSYNDWYRDAIDYSSEAYFSRLPKKMRDELKRRIKRLEEHGTVRVEITNSEAKFNQNLGQYLQVREMSWKHPEKNENFLRETREMFTGKGMLRFCFLYLDDLPIAAQIRIVCNGTAYFMEALHDKRYDRFGPGNLLRWKVIQHLLDVERVSAIDQVRGDEDYKEYWTPSKRERIGITVFNSSVKGAFFRILMTHIVPVIKGFKNSARKGHSAS